MPNVDSSSSTDDSSPQPQTPLSSSQTGSSIADPANADPSPDNIAGGKKRKQNRRINTAERRATHNAVERQRRETLNGRFLVGSPTSHFDILFNNTIRILPLFFLIYLKSADHQSLPLSTLQSPTSMLPVDTVFWLRVSYDCSSLRPMLCAVNSMTGATGHLSAESRNLPGVMDSA